MRSRILALILALLMLLALVPTQALAAEILLDAQTPADRDYDGIPDEYDGAPDNNSFIVKMKSGHDGTTDYSFTMDYRDFFGSNTQYHPALASASVVGSVLAYCLPDYGDAYLSFEPPVTWEGGSVSMADGPQLMRILGMEDVVDYKLDEVYNDDDICEVILGHRTVVYQGQTKVITALWVRGTRSTSAEEWSSNFHMGDLARFFDAYDSVEGKSPRQSNQDWTRKTNHRGFDVCATRLMQYLGGYHTTYVQPVLDSLTEAELVYWITGHSRGAAVGNLIASYLVDRGHRVFAYTYACPYNTANTEASAEKYDCIFNLVNANDFIPMLPMPEWGFTRYGRTASVDASQYATQIKNLTGATYSGNFLTASDMSTLLGKFVCITGENSDRNNPGKILGWREVYVYHCGHDHPGETVGNHQSTTFCKKQSITNLLGPTESGYNGYGTRLLKYSYWKDGICQTPAYDLQVLVELLVEVARGNTISGASTYITRNKLAEKFDFDKWSLVSYATKLTEPHFMDTYSVLQSNVGEMSDPGSLFVTLPNYANNGRPLHTHTYTYVPYEGQAPTCTQEGLGYRYCLCSQANPDYYDDYQKNVPIPALGHEKIYTYADNDTHTVTCSRGDLNETEACVYENNVCVLCGHQRQVDPVYVDVYLVDKSDVPQVLYYAFGSGDPSAAWPGEALTAAGQAVCDAEYGTPSFHNYYKVTLNAAEFSHVIFNNGSDGYGNQTADLDYVSDAAGNSYVVYYSTGFSADSGEDLWPTEPKQTVAPTCTEAGKDVYTGLFTGETREVAIPAPGHTPGEPVIENNVAPTCTEAGSYDSVVYCTECGEELSWETVTVPATGHAWGTPTYEWAEDNSAVTATVLCGNDGTHVITETVNTTYAVTTEPTAEAEGVGTYTAVFENDLFQTQTKDVVLPATGPVEPEIDPALVLIPAVVADQEIIPAYQIRAVQLTGYSDFSIVFTFNGETTVFSEENGNLEVIRGSSGKVLVCNMKFYGFYPHMMGEEYTAQAHAMKDGVEVVSTLMTGSIKSHLAGLLADETRSDTMRTLSADMLKYGAAAQEYMGYKTDDLADRNLPAEAEAALEQFATQGQATAERVNSPSGEGAELKGTAVLTYRVILSLQARVTPVLAEADSPNVKLRVKESGGDTVLVETETTVRNIGSFSLVGAEYGELGVKNLRDVYDYALVLNDAPISKTLTWSFEGYVKEQREAGADAKLLNLLNALLIYGDSAIAYAP